MCFLESARAAGFKQMRSLYGAMLARDGWDGLTADLTPSSVNLMRQWTLPEAVGFKSVSDVALAVTEDCSVWAGVRRYADEDPRYGTVLNKSRASPRLMVCGLGSLFDIRSRQSCKMIHASKDVHGHSEPISGNGS